MPNHRFYTPLPLHADHLIPLTPDESRHLKVMRSKKGDAVDLIDGQGSIALATVANSEHLYIESVKKFMKTKPLVHLLIAIPHASLLDWMVEKVTELGVDKITFFPGKLSLNKRVKFERLNRLVIAATKQSGRLYLPTLELKTSLEKPLQPCFYGSLNEEDSYLTPAETDTAFIIGPEKGFHPTELELFKRWKITGKRLNKNVLRAETASIAASAILLTRAGERGHT